MLVIMEQCHRIEGLRTILNMFADRGLLAPLMGAGGGWGAFEVNLR